MLGAVEPVGMQKRLRDHVRILQGDGGMMLWQLLHAATSVALQGPQILLLAVATMAVTRRARKHSLWKACMPHHVPMKTQ